MPRILFAIIALFLTASLIRAEEKEKSQSKPDALQAKTVWTGTSQGDSRKINSESHPARLRVLERDGEKFEVELSVQRKGGTRAALRADGRIRGDKIALRPTKIINGAWPEDILKAEIPGQIKGEEMVLKLKNDRNMETTVQLKLDKDATEKRDEPRRKGKP